MKQTLHSRVLVIVVENEFRSIARCGFRVVPVDI